MFYVYHSLLWYMPKQMFRFEPLVTNLCSRCTYFPIYKLWLLTHWGRVTHIDVTKLGHRWFRWWRRIACSAPSHYLNQCWLIVNWTLRNKYQWHLNRNSNFFIAENQIENVVCKMAAILCLPQCDKVWLQGISCEQRGHSFMAGITPK